MSAAVEEECAAQSFEAHKRMMEGRDKLLTESSVCITTAVRRRALLREMDEKEAEEIYKVHAVRASY